MKLRTQLSIPSSEQKINHQSPILGIGSCFIENIGQLLSQHKFPICLNPFGILYNPISISAALNRLLADRPYGKEELIAHQGIWYSFDHHGAFSSPKATATLGLINQSYRAALPVFDKAEWLLLTFGTSIVYAHLASDKIVANCHKIPSVQFRKKRLTIHQIVDTLSATFEQLMQKNQSVNILLTVSPIRHIKEGIIENQRSKATLLLAVEQLVHLFPQVYYFPAYELVMDDLRDYRFFEKDLVHPNSVAIDYIWEAFMTTYFTDPTKRLMKSISKIVQASQHRPFHPQSPPHQQFLQKQLENIQELEATYPFLSFEKEKEQFLKGLVILNE